MTDLEEELNQAKYKLERMRQFMEWQQADYSKIRTLQNDLHTLEAQYRLQVEEIRKYKRANEALMGALSRCRDMIHVAHDAINNEETRNDLSIYLNIVDGLIYDIPRGYLDRE